MNEANIQSLLSRKLEKEPPVQFTRNDKAKHYELKLVKSPCNTLAPSKFRPQQLPSLRKYVKKALHWKYSDADPRIKPFDGSYMPLGEGYVAVCFYTKNKPKDVQFIPIEDFLVLQEEGKISKPILLTHPNTFTICI